MKLSTDQPPYATWEKLFDSGVGRLQVTPAVNAWRMSKSALPRSIFGFATELGVLRTRRRIETTHQKPRASPWKA
jgi:hypothetical protein